MKPMKEKLNKKVIKQVIREFWMQFVLSIVWGLYKIKGDFTGEKAVETFITNFGACFFLTSWFFGQILRVKKQQTVETHLELLTNNLQKLIADLELTSKRIIDNVTGGKSFLYMTIANIDHNRDIGKITFIHSGDNPVYDVSVQYLDINKPQPNGEGIVLGTKPPRTATSGPVIKLDRKTGLHYSVFFTTRRGLVNQSLRLKFKDGKWHQAIHVSDFDSLQFFVIPEDFPIEESDKDIKQWKKWQEAQSNALPMVNLTDGNGQ